MLSDLITKLSGKIEDYSPFALRRKDLIRSIKQNHADIKNGIVVSFAGFETDCRAFHQENTFFYYTGIKEPGVVLVLDLQGGSTLYIPNCTENRSKWMFSQEELTQKNAPTLGIDTITVLGESCTGYMLHPFFPQNEYSHLLKRLQNTVQDNKTIFTLMPNNASEYIEPRLVLERLRGLVPGIDKATVDVSALVARMRRRKDMREIEDLFMAIEITTMAHESAAEAIADGMAECGVQASLEYIMTGSCTSPAFPSIVASGKNGTILHYTANNGIMRDGDLVVVDIGAKYNYYCADLTRTYPVSGTFTKRQRELYNLVLATQQYIADIAKPGYWLKNENEQDKSLHHLAKKYLAERGYDQYFTHGIGHFLGLDVHDVGDYSIPLQEGDVITIEPGIYIPEEQIGIRIEDDYWVVKDGVVCLSESLPKHPDKIEAMVQQAYEGEDNDSDMMNSLKSALDEIEH